MYGGNSSGFGQEQFVWDIKTEPGVVGVFEKLWATDKLVVSFDGGALMLPGVRELSAVLILSWALGRLSWNMS